MNNEMVRKEFNIWYRGKIYGYKYLSLAEGTKGAHVGGTSEICGAVLQSGDFFLGLACAFLLVVGGIIINRP